ncbi:outer membrane beta-barrel protein [Chrysiogenes arsenatis]|uniref:outer membrane beta-barrel protein n=1 Tax=Chrysiogenes arsenatis TaxID=309797 RepID=UPI0004839DDC|nr:outer membrane beta-barrel protein [Chrysiogenes arsenatis]
MFNNKTLLFAFLLATCCNTTFAQDTNHPLQGWFVKGHYTYSHSTTEYGQPGFMRESGRHSHIWGASAGYTATRWQAGLGYDSTTWENADAKLYGAHLNYLHPLQSTSLFTPYIGINVGQIRVWSEYQNKGNHCGTYGLQTGLLIPLAPHVFGELGWRYINTDECSVSTGAHRMKVENISGSTIGIGIRF